MAGRGALTDEMNKEAKKFLNRVIDMCELRLYPYLDYCLKNNSRVNDLRINTEERIIIAKLIHEKHMKQVDIQKEGYTDDGFKIQVTEPFYNFMQTILWMGYVSEKGSIKNEQTENIKEWMNK